MKINRPKLYLMVVVASACLAGCSDNSQQSSPTPKRADNVAAPSAMSSSSFNQESPENHVVVGPFVAIQPSAAAEARLHLSYSTFSKTNGGHDLEFVPLPPGAGPVEIVVTSPGLYHFQLINQKCQYRVKIGINGGPSFSLDRINTEHSAELAEGAKFTAVMDVSAINNYFCNVVVGRDGKS